METFKLVMAASRIPVGSTVTKATGTKEYLLKDKLVIYQYSEKIGRQEIKAGDGAFFLVCDGDIQSVPGTLELAWRVSREDLREYLFNTESHQ